MGQYLAVSIANKIYVQDSYRVLAELPEKLKENVDLSIYNIKKENSGFVLELKEEVFMKNIVPLLKEISESCHRCDKETIEEIFTEIEDKSIAQIIEESEEEDINFSYEKGSIASNDISYILDGYDVVCDSFLVFIEGKVFFECYYSMFTFFRNSIIKSLKNPLKSAIMVSIIG